MLNSPYVILKTNYAPFFLIALILMHLYINLFSKNNLPKEMDS